MALKKKTEAETKNPPADKVRVGLITASIWENQTEKGTFHNVTFERRYNRVYVPEWLLAEWGMNVELNLGTA